MIRVVSTDARFRTCADYAIIDRENAVKALEGKRFLQFLAVPNGKDAMLSSFNVMALATADDVYVIDPRVGLCWFKAILENTLLIGHNMRLAVKLLYSIGIGAVHVYDAFIAERVLYLGHPTKPGSEHFRPNSLAAIIKRRLDVDIQKRDLDRIEWEGLTENAVRTVAGAVRHMRALMLSQEAESKVKGNTRAIAFECRFVPVCAYLEWCGVRIDEGAWRRRMVADDDRARDIERQLDAMVAGSKDPALRRLVHVDTQGDLFTGFDTTPKVDIDWGNPGDVMAVARAFGFDVPECRGPEDVYRVVREQRDANRRFAALLIGDDEEKGLLSTASLSRTFGMSFINSANPSDMRIRTLYSQLGTDSGAMTCGSPKENKALAAERSRRGLDASGCGFPCITSVPHDEATRGCFTAAMGNSLVICDYDSMEARIGADVYGDRTMREVLSRDGGDIHSLMAKIIFSELGGVPVERVRDERPDLRAKAKRIDYSQMFGGSTLSIRRVLGCGEDEARSIAMAFARMFPGVKAFLARAREHLMANGHMLLVHSTGHKTFWPGHAAFLDREAQFTREFWDNYRRFHKGQDNEITRLVRDHYAERSLWDRKVMNLPTHGIGAVIFKQAMMDAFSWVIGHGLFRKVLFCIASTDECVWEFPDSEEAFPDVLKECMENAARMYCGVPIPVRMKISRHWEH